MKILKLASLILLTGCAATTGWRPTIDHYTDPRAAYINVDMMQCGELAKQAAGTAATIAQDTFVGAITGAAGGAALGAILGNPATGAALGSTAGILSGGYGAFDSDNRYRNAYRSCMRQRGHIVVG